MMKEQRIIIKKEACLGCGACVSLCPKVFALGADGKSEVIDERGDSGENIQLAVDACPVKAIIFNK